MATDASAIPLEVITEPPKYNPMSRIVDDSHSENEENVDKEANERDEQEPQKRKQTEDDCCNYNCCYEPYDDPFSDGLILCCFACKSEETGCCSGDADCCSCVDCGDCCDDCDGCDCVD